MTDDDPLIDGIKRAIRVGSILLLALWLVGLIAFAMEGELMNRLKDYFTDTDPARLTPEQTQSLWLVATWRGIAMELQRRPE